jgi:hypothetical protein
MSSSSNHLSPSGLNGHNNNNQGRFANKTNFYRNKKPYSQHEQINDDQAKEFYTCKNNPNDGRRVLKPQSYSKLLLDTENFIKT